MSGPSALLSGMVRPSKGDYLELMSPYGEQSRFYSVPLRVPTRQSNIDDAKDITATIGYVTEEFEDIREDMGEDYRTLYDGRNYEVMKDICNQFNKAVKKNLRKKRYKGIRLTRCSPVQAEHILKQCKNEAVADPAALNKYIPFSAQVYGETGSDLVNKIINYLNHRGSNNPPSYIPSPYARTAWNGPVWRSKRFVDLGSGCGLVVLQVAALTDCDFCLGIEQSDTPAGYARDMEAWFRFWMKFCGKRFSEFRLFKGNFLHPEHRSDILSSNIVFANNFSFGSLLNEQIMVKILSKLSYETKVLSSHAFGKPGLVKITENMTNKPEAIMRVYQPMELSGSVSWKNNPIQLTLHVIDTSKLEEFYFEKQLRKKSEGKKRRKRQKRPERCW